MSSPLALVTDGLLSTPSGSPGPATLVPVNTISLGLEQAELAVAVDGGVEVEIARVELIAELESGEVDATQEQENIDVDLS